MHIDYYKRNTPTPFANVTAPLSAYASGSRVSTVGGNHWIGSARADANVFLSTAYVQYVFPNDYTDDYDRIVTRGLDGTYLGTKVYLPSVLKNSVYSSWIFFQNVEAFAIDVEIKFYTWQGEDICDGKDRPHFLSGNRDSGDSNVGVYPP